MSLRRVAVVSLAAVVAACVTGQPATMPGAVAMRGGGAVTLEPFEWSADRRLTWADFQGPFDLRSGAVAVTATVVEYEMAAFIVTRVFQVNGRLKNLVSSIMQIHLLKSKIHRAEVTGANVNYEGSLTIAEDFMKNGLPPGLTEPRTTSLAVAALQKVNPSGVVASGQFQSDFRNRIHSSLAVPIRRPQT